MNAEGVAEGSPGRKPEDRIATGFLSPRSGRQRFYVEGVPADQTSVAPAGLYDSSGNHLPQAYAWGYNLPPAFAGSLSGIAEVVGNETSFLDYRTPLKSIGYLLLLCE